MAGYSGKPLAKKLGIQADHRSHVENPPAGYAKTLGRALPRREEGQLDFIQAFVRDEAELRATLPAMKERLAKTGMLWISWPKKTSKLFAGVTEDKVRALALANGLVDVKVCAVDADWSALKLVYRLSDR